LANWAPRHPEGSARPENLHTLVRVFWARESSQVLCSVSSGALLEQVELELTERMKAKAYIKKSRRQTKVQANVIRAGWISRSQWHPMRTRPNWRSQDKVRSTNHPVARRRMPLAVFHLVSAGAIPRRRSSSWPGSESYAASPCTHSEALRGLPRRARTGGIVSTSGIICAESWGLAQVSVASSGTPP